MPYAIVYPRSSMQRDVTITGPYPVPVGDWLVGGIRVSVVPVGLTPIALPPIAMAGRRWLSVYNLSNENDDPIYFLDSSGQTVADGTPLLSGDPFAINLDQNVNLYAVSEAALTPCDVRLMEGA